MLHERGLIRAYARSPAHAKRREVGTILNNLAGLYSEGLKQYKKAEPLYRRSLAITEKAFGPNHPSLVATLANLAALCKAEGRNSEASRLINRALDIEEKARGGHKP